ncbi:MAG: tRNA (adenosine(37)-N6)-threonylcarbamoyltransferase complex transferase subunit TsaD [Methylacidiphilales bacterium]|nr:tRNA (adenosine(37)-N6)-threonylcarbamoyltransferase complex transferase subunit TsaD [Candidatus Methylacidiphilales bacterium]MDW8349091.1 tRNA (adenosine(37)-N6)-threonylcarbamoyltransferase complex transferase subunit TsaD [Verrucomicrobiae bacterium]
MLVLGVETSCDETGLALVEGNEGEIKVIGSILSSQVAKHRAYGGVVPELAVRAHLDVLPSMTAQFMVENHVSWDDLDAVAVTRGPGLVASLLVGLNFARGLALATGLPLFGINHLEGHLYSAFLAEGQWPVFPFIGLIVSGGHTLIVLAEKEDRLVRLGGTLDDAAGECLDKIARLLGLPYPGGPEIERRAVGGDAFRFYFPRSFEKADTFDFSFSGLKTAVRYFLEKQNPDILRDAQFIADVCASVQEAVMEILAKKAVLAAQRHDVRRIAVGGGVACNGRLQALLSQLCQEEGIVLHVTPPALCTDNAIMIAGVGLMKIRYQVAPDLFCEAEPGWSLQ